MAEVITPSLCVLQAVKHATRLQMVMDSLPTATGHSFMSLSVTCVFHPSESIHLLNNLWGWGLPNIKHKLSTSGMGDTDKHSQAPSNTENRFGKGCVHKCRG